MSQVAFRRKADANRRRRTSVDGGEPAAATRDRDGASAARFELDDGSDVGATAGTVAFRAAKVTGSGFSSSSGSVRASFPGFNRRGYNSQSADISGTSGSASLLFGASDDLFRGSTDILNAGESVDLRENDQKAAGPSANPRYMRMQRTDAGGTLAAASPQLQPPILIRHRRGSGELQRRPVTTADYRAWYREWYAARFPAKESPGGGPPPKRYRSWIRRLRQWLRWPQPSAVGSRNNERTLFFLAAATATGGAPFRVRDGLDRHIETLAKRRKSSLQKIRVISFITLSLLLVFAVGMIGVVAGMVFAGSRVAFSMRPVDIIAGIEPASTRLAAADSSEGRVLEARADNFRRFDTGADLQSYISQSSVSRAPFSQKSAKSPRSTIFTLAVKLQLAYYNPSLFPTSLLDSTIGVVWLAPKIGESEISGRENPRTVGDTVRCVKESFRNAVDGSRVSRPPFVFSAITEDVGRWAPGVFDWILLTEAALHTEGPRLAHGFGTLEAEELVVRIGPGRPFEGEDGASTVFDALVAECKSSGSLALMLYLRKSYSITWVFHVPQLPAVGSPFRVRCSL